MRYAIAVLCLLALPFSGQAEPTEYAYGEHPKQKLDVMTPASASGAPIIVMVHGGGWRHGDKAMGRMVNNKSAHYVKKGYIFVSVNYRLLPDADPYEQAQDVAAAARYVQDHAAQWGGDARHMVLMGHSAGAHLVSLLGANPAGFGLQPWAATVALDSGGMDIIETMQERHFPLYDDAFGTDKAFWEKTSPEAQLTQQATPFLIVCSSKRQSPCAQAKDFARVAEPLGVLVEILPEDKSHAEINKDLGDDARYTAQVDGFLMRVLGR
ncbi:MAG: esterase [Azospirillum brasilense]|nr:MAG: esterase [Azospirillum brasilense]